MGPSMCNASSSSGNRSPNPLEQLSYLSVRLQKRFPPVASSHISSHGSYKTVRSPGHHHVYQGLNDTFVNARDNTLVKW